MELFFLLIPWVGGVYVGTLNGTLKVLLVILSNLMAKNVNPKTKKAKKTFKHPRRRWIRWLPRLQEEIRNLYFKNDIFQGICEIIEENANISQPCIIFDWMYHNHIDSMVIGLRKFNDGDNRSTSFRRMLEEIKENNKLINRNNNKGLHSNKNEADSTFDKLVGHGKDFLSEAQITKDIKTITTTEVRVKKYANKVVAHSNPKGKIRKYPEYPELIAMLKKIDEIFCKYYCLLTGKHLGDNHAVIDGNWKTVFFEPWIGPGSRFYFDRSEFE